MKESKYVHILSFEDIKTSAIGTKYRHVILEDINNDKKVDYVIFENKHKFMWIETLKKSLKTIVYPAEIMRLDITKNILNKIKPGLPLTIKVGDTIDIVVWYWSDWDTLSDDERALRSLEDQIWRFRSFPKRNQKPIHETETVTESEFEADNNSIDWERDYFDTMTDGMLGDYDDFQGDIDDIQTWSRG
jgi:hypothetical protein